MRAGEALRGLVRGLDAGPRIVESLAIADWHEVVGPQAAAASQAEAVRDGVLLVRTRSSAWSQELSFLREPIVERLNDRIGAPVIKAIRFQARGLTPAVTPTTPIQPTGEELDRVVLPPDLALKLQRQIALLASIRSASLRASVERGMSRDARARWWRLQNGWTECSVCGGPYRAPGDTCPICRRSR